MELLKIEIIKKAKFIYEVKDEMLKRLEHEDELKLFEDIEMPLSNVLADMEMTGIKVNGDYLDEVSKNLEIKMKIIEKQIYDLS